jgi:cellulose synthase/poly-beta-1,6-N-acetylglucosamine synthase-like glycosyltransferase
MSARRAGKRAHKVTRRDLPLVSCIMPTYNRRRFVPEAIRLFLAQDYPKKELLVLDDGEDTIVDLIPNRPQIRYLRLDRRTRSVPNATSLAKPLAAKSSRIGMTTTGMRRGA